MKKLFCCCRLETGCLIGGALAIIGSTLGLIYTILTLVMSFEINSDFFGNLMFRIYTHVMLFALVMTVVCVLLIVGIIKRNRFLLIPWLVVFGVFLPFCIVFVVIGIFPQFRFMSDHYVLMLSLLGFVIFNVYEIIVWFGVHSLYQKMAKEYKEAREKAAKLILSGVEQPYVSFE